MDPDEIFENMGIELKSDIEKIQKMLEEQEFHRLHSTFFERITILLISAMGLVTALAWDEAFKDFFEHFVAPLDTFGAKFYYAFLITVLAVILSIILGKIFLKKKV